MPADLGVVLPFLFVGAMLYTSVGHGGATVYLAVLTLAGYAIAGLVTSVLVLNILAAAVAFWMFQRAGHLQWRLLWPFLVTSVPCAYLGGAVALDGRVQSMILGGALLLAGVRFLLVERLPRVALPATGRGFWVLAVVLGAVLGFLAGATGIGGGIFLSPILVVAGWADVRQAGSVASAFIVCNSLAGLAAKWPGSPPDAAFLGPVLVVVFVGAVLGSFLGARRLPPRALRLLLGVVLVVAGLRAFV